MARKSVCTLILSSPAEIFEVCYARFSNIVTPRLKIFGFAHPVKSGLRWLRDLA